MSRFRVGQLASLSTILSFLYISNHLERHSLVEHPRLSLLLVFFVAALTCFVASFFSKWLPENRGRFATSQYQPLDRPTLDIADETQSKDLTTRLPDRPGRFLFPVLALCIAARIEVFNRVNRNQQCASPGLEPFLCILLFGYDIFSTRRKWVVPTPEDPDDPWRSIFDDIHDWLSGPRVTMVMAYLGTFIFTFGVHFSLGQFTRSTYFCFNLVDSRTETISLQWLGVVLDAVIVVLLWRVMAWTRSTQLRLRTLGLLSMVSCFSIGAIWIIGVIINGSDQREPAFGSLHIPDVVMDGIVLACLFFSAGLWISEDTPLAPASAITILTGVWASLNNITRFGQWTDLSRAAAVLPLWIILGGTILFIYCQDLRSFLLLRRPALTVLFTLLVLIATIYSSTQSTETFRARHPIDDLIFRAQTKHDLWLKQVKMSTSLPAAFRTYQEYHDGRLPPPRFDEWFQYAEGSSVIDKFRQIEEDLGPFRGLTPQALRDGVDILTSYPGVASITIRDGEVLSGDTGDSADNEDLGELAQMIRKFSKHLPDMILPINLRPTPRILPSWEDAFPRRLAELKFTNGLPSRGIKNDTNGAVEPFDTREVVDSARLAMGNVSLAEDFGQMQARGCPPASRTRAQPHWRFNELCYDCIEHNTQKSSSIDRDAALDVCTQPDLNHLHGFYLGMPHVMPTGKLLPLFGPSKTNSFRDIMIPLPKSRQEKPDNKWQFSRRYDALFWRGTAGKQAVSTHALRGNHKYRFLHLVSDPDPRDQVSMILPLRGSKQDFAHEKVSAQKANAAVPFTAGIEDLDACIGENCQLLERAYGAREDAAEPLEYRYVLLLDEDAGPPTQLLRTIRSNSVPFVSTIFRTWYTERLTPWLHFVPIDLRYQALHTTFAYFSGTVDRPPISNNPNQLEEQKKNAEWIVEQGQKWASEAIGERDMEVYLFRLLLEWGRLINDQRNNLSFRINKDGKHINTPWK